MRHFVKFYQLIKLITRSGCFLKINDISSQNLNNNSEIVAQEIFKMFMIQFSSLKEITFFEPKNIPNITFTSYPGAKDYLKNLSKLSCCSDIYSEFFHQLSQICHNIQSLNINFGEIILDELLDLISVQQNLKNLEMIQSYGSRDLTNIVKKLPNTLVKLSIVGGHSNIPLSFIAKFTNLRELVLINYFESFNSKNLQYVIIPQLQIVKFQYGCPSDEIIVRFLEINGNNKKKYV